MRILIIDDSKAMRMIVISTLRQAGFDGNELVEASNGIEALASIKATMPDLVLSDWNMPEMPGIELLKTLRKEGITVRFGFVTSESTQEMHDLAMQEGAQFVINKPFTADTFRDTLTPVLSHS